MCKVGITSVLVALVSSPQIPNHIESRAMSAPNDQRILTVLGSSAGIDDELTAWLVEQAAEIGSPIPVIAVAVIRDYMRASNALKAEQDCRRKMN